MNVILETSGMNVVNPTRNLSHWIPLLFGCTTLIPSRNENEFPYFSYSIMKKRHQKSSRLLGVHSFATNDETVWESVFVQWRMFHGGLNDASNATKTWLDVFPCAEIGHGCHFSCQKQSKSFWRPWRRLSKVGANHFQRVRTMQQRSKTM